MRTPATRIFTTTRIVGLAFIGLAVVGLLYLRFAPDTDPVSVPPNAVAGDLVLQSCDYTVESENYPADCGTLVVPENRVDPNSRLIALPVTRVRARSGDAAEEPIFFLTGGPGQSNMGFEFADRFIDDRDLVLVGYRGIDGSVRLDCPEVESALAHSTDLVDEGSFRAYADGFGSCADRLTEEGVDLASYGLVQQVDDMETARIALGYDRINLLSESAGTRTAMIYAWRHPESINRSAMAGVNPPGNFLWDAQLTDEQIGRYADLCSNDRSCSERTDNLAASLALINANMPERWLILPIKKGNVQAMSFTMMMQSTAEAGLGSAPTMFDAWLSAAEGDTSGLWVSSVLADLMVPRLFVWGQFAAGASIDFQAARDYFSSGEDFSANLGRAATAFNWGGGRLVEAWPSAKGVGEYAQVQTSEVETLLISGELDTSTPPRIAAEQLLPYLPNGHQVVLVGLVHSPSFWADQPEAGARLINTYFDSGQVDDSLYKPQAVDFTPGQTLTALAKVIAGAIVAVAIITMLSMAWIAHRVRVRGSLGRGAGAMLRSIYAPVLGLGGWFLAVLVILTALPSVPVDNELLTVGSIAVPVGLGVYWAWVHQDWSARTKRIGLAVAAPSALTGAWLGFNATEDFLSVITTIVGATIAVNLAIIILDVSNTRRATTRPSPSSPPGPAGRHDSSTEAAPAAGPDRTPANTVSSAAGEHQPGMSNQTGSDGFDHGRGRGEQSASRFPNFERDGD